VSVPELAGLPRDDDGPVFGEPWQAQAFALAVSLHERGAFTWPDWAAALGERIAAAQQQGDPDAGDTYWLHWLATLQRMVERQGLTDAATLDRYRTGWDQAAHRTPHGRPIELLPQDLPAAEDLPAG
jgi:nitrile hydratase accessory protein